MKRNIFGEGKPVRVEPGVYRWSGSETVDPEIISGWQTNAIKWLGNHFIALASDSCLDALKDNISSLNIVNLILQTLAREKGVQSLMEEIINTSFTQSGTLEFTALASVTYFQLLEFSISDNQDEIRSRKRMPIYTKLTLTDLRLTFEGPATRALSYDELLNIMYPILIANKNLKKCTEELKELEENVLKSVRNLDDDGDASSTNLSEILWGDQLNQKDEVSFYDRDSEKSLLERFQIQQQSKYQSILSESNITICCCVECMRRIKL